MPNINVTPGTGKTVATETISSTEYQQIKLIDSTATSTSPTGIASNPLEVTGANGTFPVTGAFFQATQPVSGTVAVTGVATEATIDARTGSLTESAPGTDTASSGINGRLQRIAQRITSLITALGSPFQAGASIGNTTFASTQATAANLNATVVGTGTFAVQLATNTPVGNVAHDGVDSGAPIKIGGRARTSENTAVVNNDRVDSIYDKVGKQVVLPYAIPENFVSGAITTAMTGTTSTSLVAAPAAGLRNYITTIIVSNAHATVGTDVIIQDGTGGTTLMSIPASAVYGGAVITLPTPLRQPTTATAIFCANVTTGASTKVSAVGYTGA